MPGAAQKAVLVTLGRIFLVLLIAGVTPAPALSGVPRTTPDDPDRLWSQFPLEEGAPPAPRPRPAPPEGDPEISCAHHGHRSGAAAGANGRIIRP